MAMQTDTMKPSKDGKPPKPPRKPKAPKEPKAARGKKAAPEPVDPNAPAYEWPSPSKPSALLVPAYIREGRAADKSRRQVVLGFGATALLSAVAVAGAFLLNQSATGALIEAEGNRDIAQQQVDDLAPIAEFYDGLETRRQATSTALASDLLHADLLSRVREALPGDATLSNYATASGAPCVGPDPFTTPDALGCITFAGTASSEEEVGQVVSALDNAGRNSMLVDPFVSSIQVTEGVEFTVSVNYTDEALSQRYVENPEDLPEDAAAPGTTDPTSPDGAQ